MLFTSWSFLGFFPVVVGTYWALPARARWGWLLAASCVFYAAFVPAYLLILFAVIAVDYAAGLLIAGSTGASRKRWLGLSVSANLGLLGTFKYFDFFAENARALGGLIGWNLPIPTLQLLLPIGLSFHVFQSLSYTIEVYRGHQAPERHLGIYALYVMFWPQLVAGPIERPQNLLPQFHAERPFDYDQVRAGLLLMGWGFFKKLVIADRLAPIVDPIFASPGAHGGVTLILAAVFFAFQIYCDFSGYSDIALGAARTMGFELMTNFRRPYFCRSVSEFWTRWHISLSTWFKDYVYIPLGGNRVGRSRWCANLLVVFLLSGLWHGANWTYLAWGALHGTYLIVGIVTAGFRERIYAAIAAPRLLAWIQGLTVFGLVTFAWIFFRAPSLEAAWRMTSRLPVGLAAQLSDPAALRTACLALGNPKLEVGLPLALIAGLLAAEGLQARVDVGRWLAARPFWLRLAAYEALVLAVLVLGVFERRSFIYFQF